jgi:2-polyprenyl-3-methyl-5-hydroxy-6-metoxy-1,4-benzoquinol methylase
MTSGAPTQRFFTNRFCYLEKDFGIAVRGRIIAELLADLGPGTRLLDAGCGDGTISLPFIARGVEVTLFDASEGMLNRARANVAAAGGNATLLQSKINDLDGLPQFDAILALGVFAYLDSVAATLRAFAEHLQPGGRVIVSMTDRDRVIGRMQYAHAVLMRRWGGDPIHLNPLRASDLAELAAKVGLQVVASRGRNLVLPGMDVCRRVGSARGTVRWRLPTCSAP